MPEPLAAGEQQRGGLRSLKPASWWQTKSHVRTDSKHIILWWRYLISRIQTYHSKFVLVKKFRLANSKWEVANMDRGIAMVHVFQGSVHSGKTRGNFMHQVQRAHVFKQMVCYLTPLFHTAGQFPPHLPFQMRAGSLRHAVFWRENKVLRRYQGFNFHVACLDPTAKPSSPLDFRKGRRVTILGGKLSFDS